MEKEVLIALFLKIMDEKFAELPRSRGDRGPRGPQGPPGKDFVFDEHEEKIKSYAKEFSLKFEDLTEDQKESLRGFRGKDGKDFIFSEHEEKIRDILLNAFLENRKDLVLKFSDLTEEEKSSLRGADGKDGRDGKDGKSFIFEEHIEFFNSLKLKFSDLTEEEKESLRGPVGHRGPAGKSFVFEEHREFFESLKMKFVDLTDSEKDELKLRFEHLTEDEIFQLKLKFSDLTDEDRLQIRGPRGQRGKMGATGPQGPQGDIGPRGEKGDTGPQGERGPRGIRGLPGPSGPQGVMGPEGPQGLSGLDAPYVTDIELESSKTEFFFTFLFSDGSEIKTNGVPVPKGEMQVYVVGGGMSGTGPKGNDGKSAYDIWIEAGNVGTEQDFLDSLVGPQGLPGADGADGADGAQGPQGDPGPQGPQGDPGPQGPQGDPGPSGSDQFSITIDCDTSVFVSAAVYLDKTNESPINMGGWTNLIGLTTLTPTTYDIVAKNALADDAGTSNVAGIVDSKPTSDTCVLKVGGVTGNIFFGLDSLKEYYLSDEYAGALVPEDLKPSSPGSVVVKIGQPLNSEQMIYCRGDREFL